MKLCINEKESYDRLIEKLEGELDSLVIEDDGESRNSEKCRVKVRDVKYHVRFKSLALQNAYMNSIDAFLAGLLHYDTCGVSFEDIEKKVLPVAIADYENIYQGGGDVI